MRALRVFTMTAALLALGTAAGAQSQGQRSTAERAAARQAAHEALMAMERPIAALDSVWLEELTWLEVRDAVRGGKTTIIVSTGGMEQNGPYLATGKHNYVNRAGCEAVARKLGNALCAPNVPFVPEGGIDPPTGAMRYPGSIGVTDSTFHALLSDIANSLRVTGFEHIVLIGDSGGNQDGMKEVASTLSAQWSDTGSRIHYVPDYYTHFDKVIEFAEQTFGWKQVSEGYHDDALISAIMMTVDPETVRIDQRIAAGKASINGIALTPVDKAVDIGKQLVNLRADLTVAAIRKAIAGTGPQQ